LRLNVDNIRRFGGMAVDLTELFSRCPENRYVEISEDCEGDNETSDEKKACEAVILLG
jgi:hypothetical protein